MTLKRWFIFMFLSMIAILSWTAPSVADDTQKVINPEGGECKMDDEYKKQIAEQAVTALTGAKENYAQFVKILKNDYESEGGSCHPLYSSWHHSSLNLFKSWGGDLEDASELSWTDADRKGAEIIDGGQYIAAPNPTCTAMMEEINKDKSYSDWHIFEMRDMAASSNAEINDIFMWAQKAKDGESMNVSSDAGNKICMALGSMGNSNGCKSSLLGHNECDKMTKKGNSLVCFDTGMGSTSGGCVYTENGKKVPCKKAADGKCYIHWGNSNRKEVPCSVILDDSDIAATFASADDFKNRIVEGDQGTKDCLAKFDKAIEFRNKFMNNRADAEQKLSMLGGADVQCFCKKDEATGELTDQIEDCVSLQDTEKENLERECKTIPEYQAEFRDICLTCGLMAKILLAAQRISESAFPTIAPQLVEILGLAFLIFIAYTVLLTVASPEPQKISKLLGSLLAQGAKVAIAVLLLTNGEYVYRIAINPILDGGVDFGLAFTNISSGAEGTDSATDMDITLSEKIKAAGVDEITTSGTEINGQSEFLSASTIEKLIGANKNFSAAAAEIPAIGRCMICNSTHKLTWDNFKVIPRMKMLITGIILLVFGVMIWVAVGFYLLDCCLQLCLVVAMIPFFIACWPFKLTNSYLKVGWNMFLNTFFNFVMMSVVIVTIVLLISNCLPKGLEEAMNGGDLDYINEQLEIIGLKMIQMVIVCMICLKLSRESGRLANKFAGGSQIKMGGELGGLAADTGKKLAVGNMGETGKDGKKQGMGGALGLAKRTAGVIGGSAAEASGLKGMVSAKKQAVKNALGGGTKSQGASFKQNDGGGDKGGDGGDKGGDGGDRGGDGGSGGA